MSGPRTIHIYQQNHPHDTVHIIGDTSALTLLANELLGACILKTSECHLQTADGESFKVKIVCKKDMENVMLPYAGEEYGTHGLPPHEVKPETPILK